MVFSQSFSRCHRHHELKNKGNSGGSGTGNSAGSTKNQQGQQKQKKQQKGEGGASGTGTVAAAAAAVGNKRDRDEAAAGDATRIEVVSQSDGAGPSSKRPHLATAGGDRIVQQEPQDVDDQVQEGGEGRWAWGSSPSPKRDGGDDADGAEEPQRRNADANEQREEDYEEVDRLDGSSLEQIDCGEGAVDEANDEVVEKVESADDDGVSVAMAAGVSGGAAAAAAWGISVAVDAAAAGSLEPECRLCASMVKAGRDRMMAAIQQLGGPASQKLGAMILAYGNPRFEQLWDKLSFVQLQVHRAGRDQEQGTGTPGTGAGHMAGTGAGHGNTGNRNRRGTGADLSLVWRTPCSRL